MTILEKSLQSLQDYLKEQALSLASGATPFTITDTSIAHNQLTILTESSCLHHFIRFLKEDSACLFKILIDITAVDYPHLFPTRFHVVYHLLSVHHNQRIRIKVATSEHEPIPSLIPLFPSADWYEREVFDMFGVIFAYHPDLRRILSDYGFAGHPLRKDFPLTGFVEVQYDYEKKRVMYDKVNLVQEFRTFDFESPWEGIQDVVARHTHDKEGA